jgi:hypothetical protein
MTMPREMKLTVHAQQRMKTRSIALETIDLILAEGEAHRSGKGFRYQLPENVIEELEELINLPLPPDKLAKVYVIVGQGNIVTVAHDNQSTPGYFSLGVRAHRPLIH